MLNCCEIRNNLVRFLNKKKAAKKKIDKKKGIIIEIAYIGFCCPNDVSDFVNKVKIFVWQINSLKSSLKKNLCEHCQKQVNHLEGLIKEWNEIEEKSQQKHHHH